jgi:hypothetical protein
VPASLLCRVRDIVTVVALGACITEDVWSGNTGTADYAVFEAEVYPVLMRDCGYANCHGVEERAFQVWGPGRARLKTSGDLVTAERARTYARALSMLYTDGTRPLEQSLLLTKPLELSAGGATHAGVDHYGRNVYRSQQEPGFQVLSNWARQLPTVGPRATGSAGASGALATTPPTAGASGALAATPPTAGAGAVAGGAAVGTAGANSAGSPATFTGAR